MNLKFSKNATKDIEVLVQIGTNQKPFSYIDMIKSLLAGETLDTEFSEDISGDEKKTNRGTYWKNKKYSRHTHNRIIRFL